MTTAEYDAIREEVISRLVKVYVLRGRLDNEMGLTEPNLTAEQLKERITVAERVWGEFESMRIFIDYLTTHESPPEVLLQRFCDAARLPQTLLDGL